MILALWHAAPVIQLRTVRDEELTADELAELRAFLNAAYDHEFGDEDWRHARGGSHVLGLVGAELVAHAAVVPRNLRSGSRVWRTGYVEAVGVRQDQRGHGHGRTVMLKGRRAPPRDLRAGRVVRRTAELALLRTPRLAAVDRPHLRGGAGRATPHRRGRRRGVRPAHSGDR
nr:hypothetical protein GCM10020241_62570 [Streptoalloteichus tenebrarius]